jgi:hypothetical protein
MRSTGEHCLLISIDEPSIRNGETPRCVSMRDKNTAKTANSCNFDDFVKSDAEPLFITH